MMYLFVISTAIVLVTAMSIWLSAYKARRGIIGDAEGNEKYVGDRASAEQVEALQNEIDRLRVRVRVLERIATDEHSSEAQHSARISREIDGLFDEDKRADDRLLSPERQAGAALPKSKREAKSKRIADRLTAEEAE